MKDDFKVIESELITYWFIRIELCNDVENIDVTTRLYALFFENNTFNDVDERHYKYYKRSIYYVTLL